MEEGSSGNPKTLAQRLLGNLDKTMRGLSPWVQRALSQDAPGKGFSPAKPEAGPTIALTEKANQAFIDRATRNLEGNLIWHPEVGSLSPATVDQFSSEIVQRYPEITGKYAVEIPQSEESSEDDLVLPPSGGLMNSGLPFITGDEPRKKGRTSRPSPVEEASFTPPTPQQQTEPAAPERFIHAPAPIQRKPGVRPISRIEEVLPGGETGSKAGKTTGTTSYPEDRSNESFASQAPAARDEGYFDRDEAAPKPAEDSTYSNYYQTTTETTAQSPDQRPSPSTPSQTPVQRKSGGEETIAPPRAQETSGPRQAAAIPRRGRIMEIDSNPPRSTEPAAPGKSIQRSLEEEWDTASEPAPKVPPSKPQESSLPDLPNEQEDLPGGEASFLETTFPEESFPVEEMTRAIPPEQSAALDRPASMPPVQRKEVEAPTEPVAHPQRPSDVPDGYTRDRRPETPVRAEGTQQQPAPVEIPHPEKASTSVQRKPVQQTEAPRVESRLQSPLTPEPAPGITQESRAAARPKPDVPTQTGETSLGEPEPSPAAPEKPQPVENAHPKVETSVQRDSLPEHPGQPDHAETTRSEMAPKADVEPMVKVTPAPPPAAVQRQAERSSTPQPRPSEPPRAFESQAATDAKESTNARPSPELRAKESLSATDDRHFEGSSELRPMVEEIREAQGLQPDLTQRSAEVQRKPETPDDSEQPSTQPVDGQRVEAPQVQRREATVTSSPSQPSERFAGENPAAKVPPANVPPQEVVQEEAHQETVPSAADTLNIAPLEIDHPAIAQRKPEQPFPEAKLKITPAADIESIKPLLTEEGTPAEFSHVPVEMPAPPVRGEPEIKNLPPAPGEGPAVEFRHEPAEPAAKLQRTVESESLRQGTPSPQQLPSQQEAPIAKELPAQSPVQREVDETGMQVEEWTGEPARREIVGEEAQTPEVRADLPLHEAEEAAPVIGKAPTETPPTVESEPSQVSREARSEPPAGKPTIQRSAKGDGVEPASIPAEVEHETPVKLTRAPEASRPQQNEAPAAPPSLEQVPLKNRVQRQVPTEQPISPETPPTVETRVQREPAQESTHRGEPKDQHPPVEPSQDFGKGQDLGDQMIRREQRRSQMPVSYQLRPQASEEQESDTAVEGMLGTGPEPKRTSSGLIAFDRPTVLPQPRESIQRQMETGAPGEGPSGEQPAAIPYPLIQRKSKGRASEQLPLRQEASSKTKEPAPAQSQKPAPMQISSVQPPQPPAAPPVIQRSPMDGSPPAEVTSLNLSEKEKEEDEKDAEKKLADLARKVYPLIKRMLAIERERTYGR